MNDYHCAADQRPPYEPGRMLCTVLIALLGLCTIAWAIGISRTTQADTLQPVPDAKFPDSAVIAPATGLTFDGVVLRVIDGDTLIVEHTTSVRIRLLDCWAPESRTLDLAEKQKGLKAKARLTQLASGKPVRVHFPTSGDDLSDTMTLGRVLGRVWLVDDGEPRRLDLSAQMVREGLARKAKAP